MKRIYLPLAGLLIFGILSTAEITAAAAIDDSISGAHIADIARTIDINNIQIDSIDTIADRIAINETIQTIDIGN